MKDATKQEPKSRREYIAAWRAKHPGVQKTYYIKKHYGLLPEHVVELLEAQQGKCHTCKKLFDSEVSYHPHFPDDQAPVLLCHSCKIRATKAPKNTAGANGLP